MVKNIFKEKAKLLFDNITHRPTRERLIEEYGDLKIKKYLRTEDPGALYIRRILWHERCEVNSISLWKHEILDTIQDEFVTRDDYDRAVWGKNRKFLDEKLVGAMHEVMDSRKNEVSSSEEVDTETSTDDATAQASAEKKKKKKKKSSKKKKK